MTKIGNTILLLSYLQNGRKYSLQELSEKLEVNKRMVRYYKEELEKVGFYIESIRGPYGGYILRNTNKIPPINWKETDLELLKKLETENPILKKEINRVIEKMKLCIWKEEKLLDEPKKPLFNLFSKACKEHWKVKITYLSFNKCKTTRIINPYELFYFQNGWGITAFCELKQDLRNFELQRIIEAKILSEKF